jgi:oxalate---CoA ligase
VGDHTQAATLLQLIEARNDTHGSRSYLEDARSDRIVSYADLAASTRRWAQIFTEAQLPANASVLLDVDDPLAFATCYLAVIAAGRCVVPIDPAMPAGEFTRAIETLRPAAVIGTTHAAVGSMLRFEPELAPADWSDQPAAQRPAPGRLRLRTSGSTGEPKIVELTEAQLLHVARAVATHNELTTDDRGFNPLPLFHINGEVVALLATLVAGATLVLDRRFHRSDFWDLIEQRRITWINAVPAILTILSREALPARPPALRLVRSASAALPEAIRAKLTGALGDIVLESYGMTEAASQITATTPGEPAPAGSAGRPVGIELQVRAPDGRHAATGEIGRIWLRGPGVIGHYVDGRAADRFDHEGWLDSGDLGRIDAQGYLFLAGRTDDVINRGGQLVYPREIEEVLLGDDAVLDAIVVGRPDEVLGAVPVAYVIARDVDTAAAGESLRLELEQRCRDQLSRYKQPASVQLVDDLPRAATGKIRRGEVRRAEMSLTR